MASTSIVAIISIQECLGCGICVDVCKLGAIPRSFIGFIATHAQIDEIRCDGCGSCVPLCPQKAIKLIKIISSLE